jgi:hypothetical protein
MENVDSDHDSKRRNNQDEPNPGCSTKISIKNSSGMCKAMVSRNKFWPRARQ